MVFPTVPTFITVAVFVVLCLLLIQKEIMRALGQSGPPRWRSPRWRLINNSMLGLLLVVYGAILLSRFLFLLR